MLAVEILVYVSPWVNAHNVKRILQNRSLSDWKESFSSRWGSPQVNNSLGMKSQEICRTDLQVTEIWKA